MKEFFKSARFKMLIFIVLVLIFIMIIAGNLGGWASPQTTVAGAVTTPLQKVSAGFSNAINDFFGVFRREKELRQKNEELQKKVDELTGNLIDYQTILHENQEYSQYLEIKKENPEFKMMPVSVIARDPVDNFGSFTIDKGTLHGISLHNPVITSSGLVGYIWEAAPTTCKVMTVLNPEFNVGVIDRRTRDDGLVSGTLKSAEKGLCEMRLVRSSSAAVDDLIVTSGAGGIFPKNLLIGRIESIGQNQNETYLIAQIRPAADIFNLRDAMIITSFNSQSD